MQKLVGSILIILACTGFGIEKSNEIKTRMQQMEELKKIFTLMQSELKYQKIPFSDLFHKISRKTDGIFREWLFSVAETLDGRQKETMQEIWENSIKECLQETMLGKEEIDELINLGTSLGYWESIGLYLEQLESRIQTAREEMRVQRKMFQSIGVMGGIFLVIILL